MSDIETEWTLNASSTIFSSYRKCSKRRIRGHSAQTTSRLLIGGTTKCSRIARGFGCGGISGFAAEVRLKAALGFRASAAFLLSASMRSRLASHSESGDQPPHLSHCFEVQWCGQAANTPPVLFLGPYRHSHDCGQHGCNRLLFAAVDGKGIRRTNCERPPCFLHLRPGHEDLARSGR